MAYGIWVQGCLLGFERETPVEGHREEHRGEKAHRERGVLEEGVGATGRVRRGASALRGPQKSTVAVDC